MSQKKHKLLQNTKETYGKHFTGHLFEQYKHYVESAEKISERRTTANNFFLTVNSFLLTFNGLLAGFGVNKSWLIIPSIAGFFVSLTWYSVIKSYRDLNTVKFEVLHELEEHMPVALYGYEWCKAEQGKGGAYKPTSHIEKWVPIIFMVLYSMLFVIGGVVLYETIKENLCDSFCQQRIPHAPK
jgi:hypothetical protein